MGILTVRLQGLSQVGPLAGKEALGGAKLPVAKELSPTEFVRR